MVEGKPLYRGVSHLFGFFVVLGAAPTLVAFAQGSRATLAATVYGLSLAAMLGFSALYHRSGAPPRIERWLERADHSAIFVFIAGSYTPFCLLLRDQGPILLAIVWSGALFGVLQALFWINAPRWVSVPIYLVVGWTVVPFVPKLWAALGATGVMLLFAGGVLYSVGGVVFAMGKPNPWPRHFGFHEIFHALVVVACVCHFVAVATALKRMGS